MGEVKVITPPRRTSLTLLFSETRPVSQSPEDLALVELTRGGDQEAARQLFDAFVGRLVVLARKHISQRLASRIDPEDIVQSVFRTFFARLKQGQFQLADENDLGKLLVRITVHKTLRQVSFHKADKRSPDHEVHPADSRDGSVVLGLLAREPSAEVTIAFLDQLEHFLRRLRPIDRDILEMRMDGYSTEEIATKLGLYDRKIRRFLERIRELAEREGFTPG